MSCKFKKKNVDTECISKIFTDNIFGLISAKMYNLAIKYPLVTVTALFNVFMVMFRAG